jgi:hypothetical protein
MKQYLEHLSNIDCFMARNAWLVCFISTVKAAAKKEKKPIKTGASSGHITNLKQSILETFDIYDLEEPSLQNSKLQKLTLMKQQVDKTKFDETANLT